MRLLAAVSVLALALTAPAAADWPEFGYNPGRQNVGPASTGITAANVGKLKRRQIMLDGTVDSSPIYLHGVTVDGHTHDTFFVTTTYGITLAIDATTGLELIRRPANKTSVSAVWQPIDALTLSATALWVGDWMDVPRAGGASSVAPGYNTINLAANYKMNENLVVFGRIDNLLDKHYEDPLGFEKTGIGVYGGVRVIR